MNEIVLNESDAAKSFEVDFENGGFRVLPQCSSKREKKARERVRLSAGLSQCRKNFLRAAKATVSGGHQGRSSSPRDPDRHGFPPVSRGTDVPDRPRECRRATPLASLSPLSLRPTEQSPFPSPAPRFQSLVAANGPMAEKTAAAIGMRNARLENEPRRSSPMAEGHRWFCSPITSECFAKRVCKIYRLILTLLLQREKSYQNYGVRFRFC